MNRSHFTTKILRDLAYMHTSFWVVASLMPLIHFDPDIKMKGYFSFTIPRSLNFYTKETKRHVWWVRDWKSPVNRILKYFRPFSTAGWRPSGRRFRTWRWRRTTSATGWTPWRRSGLSFKRIGDKILFHSAQRTFYSIHTGILLEYKKFTHMQGFRNHCQINCFFIYKYRSPSEFERRCA